MVKRVFLVMLAIIIILIGVGGCMPKQNEPSVKEQVEKYMKDKYNEEFKFLGGGTEGWNAPETEIYVSSEKFPDAKIMIRRGKKSGEMIDNYMDFLMKSKIEVVMNAIVSKIYPKSKVLYSTGGAPLDGTTPQMSVEEYIKYSGKNLALSLTICISDLDYKTNKDQKLEQLRIKLEEKKYMCKFYIFYVLGGKLELVNDTNKNDLYSNATATNWSMMRGDFSLDSSYKFLVNRWREIK
jgi:hypothetical protein